MATTIIDLPNLSANNIRKKKRSEANDIMAPLVLPVAGQRDATYKSAYLLIRRIDSDLTRGARHYWTRAGILLCTLDEVVNAILDNDLLEPES